MDNLSKHFSHDEFVRSSTADRLGIDNTPNCEQLANAKRLAADVLEPIREQFGPVRVTSWLRVPELNDAIPGSSARSYHQYGLAADIVTPDLDLLMRWANNSLLPFDLAILEYNQWVHMQAPRLGVPPRRRMLRKDYGTGYADF